MAGATLAIRSIHSFLTQFDKRKWQKLTNSAPRARGFANHTFPFLNNP